ncbi:MAG: tRNA 5-methoxyuridine(34)/uridine 5-oxyacetic acid(34) synthase CmoB [Gammaproteobacteria bacterium]|nr:tRNA 5-methoxyuridine(34)/uridine 5-oxyacetic acid(34) synthase CmoB [Gammaproteobacteria bacterium]
MATLIDFEQLARTLPQWETFFKHHLSLADADYWTSRNRDFNRWYTALTEIANLPNSSLSVHSDRVEIEGTAAVEEPLRALMPWRKGPYFINGVHVDTEWRSDWKWDRLLPHIDVIGKSVLDVGCGNGYHMWRALQAGASWCLGVDPSPLFLCQFAAIKALIDNPPNLHLLPIGAEALPDIAAFDIALSMGVIYHRRDPIAHIHDVTGTLKPGGTMVLESIVIQDDFATSLIPESRYARMRNVWCIPSPLQMIAWMREAGLQDCQVVDVGKTTLDEQRTTRWMPYESLDKHLDPNDHSKTVEGYPAPYRAICIGTKP